MTSGDFTSGARIAAPKATSRVVLIEEERLDDLMISAASA
ncbi:MAG: hypothetical protein JSR77_10095 [Planctomycetes bacterium]|nr:hypothetical protein [Planctomycetota bacterium]